MFENVTNIYVQIMYMQTKLKTPQFIETVFIILEFFNKIGIQDQLKLTYNQLKFTCTKSKYIKWNKNLSILQDALNEGLCDAHTEKTLWSR